jgi:hypothetical protein
MYGEALIGELIANICQRVNLTAPPDHYYLMFDAHELDINDTIRKSGLLNSIGTSDQNYPELRLKVVHQMEQSSHVGTHIVLASPEKLDYQDILKIPASPTQQQIMPEILQPLVKQLAKYQSKSSMLSSKLISMPVFTKQMINELPSMYVTVPLKPKEFDWNTFLECLAIDLEIDRNDMFIMNVQEGSTKYEIKFKASISLCKDKMKKIAKKISAIVLSTSKSAEFAAKQKLSSDIQEVSKIEAVLKNFSENEDPISSKILTTDDIDAFLKPMQRPAIIDPPVWNFLTEKSRKLSTCILHALQTSTIEFVIESMALIHNEELYHKYTKCAVHGEEMILFHGTKTANFDGIFELNFKNFHTTDAGWYGQGMYFSSSPKYCATYAGSSTSVLYLICSLVKLGKVYHVKDRAYDGQPMRADSDTHYVKVTECGSPTKAEDSFFEEFVIKQSNQILPLYIVGLRNVLRFVLWRDAKITDSHNSFLFEQMKECYNFNIYGSETSTEALAILQCKLNDPHMQCVVVTNGADEGEQFARQCRNIRSSLPIIVYCSKVDYHQQWAAKINEHPKIQVTGSSHDVFNFINSTFPKAAIF